jgi:hypothetical protein
MKRLPDALRALQLAITLRVQEAAEDTAKQESPADISLVAAVRWHLSSADDATLAAAAEIDGKPNSLTNGKVLTRDEHRAAAREALAKARALMAAPPTPPATGSPEGTLPTPNPWADDADAKALLAEAEALIEGKKP